jgi:hypothetical protein
MKRTLIAIGIALLISMMLVPHGSTDGSRFWTHSERVEVFWPFFLNTPHDWYVDDICPRAFVLQTLFLCTLFAVLANIHWRKKKMCEESSQHKEPAMGYSLAKK